MNILKRERLYLKGKLVRSVLMLSIITLISTLMLLHRRQEKKSEVSFREDI